MHGHWIYLLVGVIAFFLGTNLVVTEKKKHSTMFIFSLIAVIIAVILSFMQYFYPISSWSYMSHSIKILVAFAILMFYVIYLGYILNYYFFSKKKPKSQ
jgi:hypothetical protein